DGGGELPLGFVADAVQAGQDQVFLAGEIVIDRRLGQVEDLGDLIQAGGRVPALSEQAGGHPEYLVDPLGPPQVSPADGRAGGWRSRGHRLTPDESGLRSS